jgi:glycine betaine/choline ABC-type transport system substrate-binding protein
MTLISFLWEYVRYRLSCRAVKRWVAILLVLVVGCAGAGCGGSAGAKEPSEVTITVGSLGYPEDELLREIYAHALESAGFHVRRSDLAGGLLLSGLEQGRVSGYPEHLDMAFAEATSTEPWGAPVGTEEAYRETKELFGQKGLFRSRPPLSGGPARLRYGGRRPKNRGSRASPISSDRQAR